MVRGASTASTLLKRSTSQALVLSLPLHTLPHTPHSPSQSALPSVSLPRPPPPLCLSPSPSAGEWSLDLAGTRDPDGWRYARGLGFWHHPSGTMDTWHLEKKGNTLVRRRRWVRNAVVAVGAPDGPLGDGAIGTALGDGAIGAALGAASSDGASAAVSPRPTAGAFGADAASPRSESGSGSGSPPPWLGSAGRVSGSGVGAGPPGLQPWVAGLAPNQLLLHRGVAGGAVAAVELVELPDVNVNDAAPPPSQYFPLHGRPLAIAARWPLLLLCTADELCVLKISRAEISRPPATPDADANSDAAAPTSAAASAVAAGREQAAVPTLELLASISYPPFLMDQVHMHMRMAHGVDRPPTLPHGIAYPPSLSPHRTTPHRAFPGA